MNKEELRVRLEEIYKKKQEPLLMLELDIQGHPFEDLKIIFGVLTKKDGELFLKNRSGKNWGSASQTTTLTSVDDFPPVKEVAVLSKLEAAGLLNQGHELRALLARRAAKQRRKK
ncbi:MAG: hypothetical protein ABIC19_02680 [Patescibacteria group bacterium]